MTARLLGSNGVRMQCTGRGKHAQQTQRKQAQHEGRSSLSSTAASPGFEESRATHSKTGLLVTTAPSNGTDAKRRGKATMSVMSGDARASRISCSMLVTASDAPSTSTVPGVPAQHAEHTLSSDVRQVLTRLCTTEMPRGAWREVRLIQCMLSACPPAVRGKLASHATHDGCAALTLSGCEGVAQDDRVEGAQSLLRCVLSEGGLATPQHPPLLFPLQAHHLRRAPAAVFAWVGAGAIIYFAMLTGYFRHLRGR